MRARHARRGALHYVGLGLNVGLLLMMVALAALTVVIPRVTGAVPLTILTSSMEPRLPPGTLVIARPIAADEVRLGMVIVYQLRSGSPETVTHRVVGITTGADGEKTFTTRGDNNPQDDPNPVRAVQVKGEVWYSLPLLGYVAVGLGGATRSWIVVVIAVCLAAFGMFMFVSWAVDRRRRALL